MRIRSLGALLLVLSPSIAAASADAIDAKDVSHRLFSKLQSLQASPPAAVARRGHLALLGSPYGLYASLHTAVTAVLHAIGNDQPLCLKAHRERHPKAPSIPIAFTFAAGQSDEEDANAVVPVAGGWYEAGVGRVSPPPRPDPHEPVEAAAGSSRSRRAEDPTRRRPGRSIASMASLDATQKRGRRARDEDEVTAVFDY